MEKISSVDEFHVSIDNAEFSHLLQSQPKKLYSNSWRRRQIQKVPPHIRQRVQRREQLYDPMMFSIGPYHHGKPELRRAEEFMYICLDRLTDENEKKKIFFYTKILDEIEVIRDSYTEVEMVEKYDDKLLALMMLLDASIIVDHMHNFIGKKENSFLDWQRCLGAGSGPMMMRDMLVTENQIPFRVVKLMISLQYEEEEAALFVPMFMSHTMGLALKHAAIPREQDDPPIHFLEAFWRVLVKKHPDINSSTENRFLLYGLSMIEEMRMIDVPYTPRSVMDLKAKGIRLRPNSTHFLRDITFKPSACFSQLYLPLQCVSDLSPVVWANMIAYEVLPNQCTSLVFTSYAIFMKSLIQSCDDVKEMQERGLMPNRVANLEKVVELFREIDTFGVHDEDVFKDVKRQIEDHCNNRARPWFAELIYTQFRTPWTAIAMFAAVILLCLTFVQTFYTIHPEKGLN